jgi:hypothetical protein
MLRLTIPLLFAIMAGTTGCSDSFATADAGDYSRAEKCEAIVLHETVSNDHFATSSEHLRETLRDNLVNTCRQSGDMVINRLYRRYDLG